MRGRHNQGELIGVNVGDGGLGGGGRTGVRVRRHAHALDAAVFSRFWQNVG